MSTSDTSSNVTGERAVLLGAGLSLILGLASIPLLKSITGIPAAILGFLTLRRINVQGGSHRVRNVAIVGMVLGLVGILLEVVGIVSILLLKANEAADRLSSVNNLRMIGFAFHSYHENAKHYPRGTMLALDAPIVDGLPVESPPQDRLSWMASILPYLEPPRDRLNRPVEPRFDTTYGRLYEDLNLREGWRYSDNRPIADATVRPYVIKSFPHYDPNGKPAPSHYVGMAGLGAKAAELPTHSELAGVLGYDRIVTMRDVLAGTSATSLAVETTFENGPWIAGGRGTVRGVPDGERPLFGRGRAYGGCFTKVFDVVYLDGHVDEKTFEMSPLIFRYHATLTDEGKKNPPQ